MQLVIEDKDMPHSFLLPRTTKKEHWRKEATKKLGSWPYAIYRHVTVEDMTEDEFKRLLTGNHQTG